MKELETEIETPKTGETIISQSSTPLPRFSLPGYTSGLTPSPSGWLCSIDEGRGRGLRSRAPCRVFGGKSLFVFVLAIAALIVGFGAVAQTINDRTVLELLYDATGGASWKNSTKWKSMSSLNNWYGVSADSNDQVVTLYLQANNLSGTIPTELENLSSLVTLDVNLNNLSGGIPSELGNLPSLEFLQLQANNLGGTIPSELGNLSSLRALNLHKDNLSGTIPGELGNLTNLEWMIFYNNNLSGTIPSELGNLPNFRYVFLDDNKLSGTIPVELANLSGLRSLYLDNNNLSGTIPSELGDLSDFSLLSLHKNNLSGTIPSELGNLSNLLDLSLNNNNLSGTIPSELGDLSSLTRLYLNNNNLSGTIPTELGNLSSLTRLYLNNNNLSGTIPSELEDLSKLFRLYLNNNNLSGTVPSELGDLSKLVRLVLNNNNLSGTVPSELGDLSKLEYLDLSLNNLSGTVPSELGNLPYIEHLDLSSNSGLTGELSLGLLMLYQKSKLSITGTGIPIPTSGVNERTVLETLYDATDGASWKKRTRWKSIERLNNWHGVLANSNNQVMLLQLQDNNLSGTIPSELGDLPNLIRLQLQDNNLSGTIPGELGNLSNLLYLYLDNNNLSGTIPSELGNLNLLRLYLDNNNLSGTVPGELGNLTNIEYLDLSSNSGLTGELSLGLLMLYQESKLSIAGTGITIPRPEVTVNPTSLSVSEGDIAGVSYTVALNTEPTGTVTVTVGGVTDDLSVNPSSPTTFTSSDWSVKKTVTVTAVDDALGEGEEQVDLTHTVNGYGSVTSADSVKVAITDNDTPEVTVNPTSLSVSEGDIAGVSYTVALNTEPTGTVTVTVGGVTDDLSVNPSSPTTFTSSDWSVKKTVTVTAVDDALGEGEEQVDLTHTVNGYGSVTSADSVKVTITDNDTPGVTVNPTSLSVSEGDIAGMSYTVALNTEPTGTVTVTVGGVTDDLSVNPSSPTTFTSSDWSVKKTVTVTAVDDALGEGEEQVDLTHTVNGYGSVTSADSVKVTITDNDTPGVTVNPTSLSVSEGDIAGVSYTVALNTEPTGTVTVTVGGVTDDLSVNPSSPTTFTSSDWSVKKTVTVTAVDDALGEGEEQVDLTHTVNGYGSVTSADSVKVTITDNDTPGVTVNPTSLSVPEGDIAGMSYTVALNTEPTGTVTVTVGGVTDDLSVNPSSPTTFTSSDWSVKKTVTVTAVDDALGEGEEQVDLTHTVNGYGSVTSADSVKVTITDNDTPGVTVNPTSLSVSEGDIAGMSYTVALNTEPTGTVTVTVGGVTDDLSVNPSSPTTFTSSDWSVKKTVTVTAVDDALGEGEEQVDLTHTVNGYGSVTSADSVKVAITDNDTPEVTEQLTQALEQPMPTPEQPTPTPEQPMPTPEQPTPTPEQPTPTPEQPMPTPEQPTPTPEQPTPTPEQPTPTPEQPTPTPEQGGEKSGGCAIAETGNTVQSVLLNMLWIVFTVFPIVLIRRGSLALVHAETVAN